MVTVEKTMAEQQNSSSLTALTPVIPDVHPRSTKIVEGAYWPDPKYGEKLQEQKAQHEAVEGALKDCGYNVPALPIILAQCGSECHTASCALATNGIGHGPASKVMYKLHAHTMFTFHSSYI